MFLTRLDLMDNKSYNYYMTKALNDPLWRDRVSKMTASEKDEELRLSVTLRFYDRVEHLVKKGGVEITCPPQPEDLLNYAIVEACDFKMTNLLLDLGARADHCKFADVGFFFYEDRDQTYDLLVRLADAGLPLFERAAAGAQALSDNRNDMIEKLKQPTEDIYLFVESIKKLDYKDLWQTIDKDNTPYQKKYDEYFKNGITVDKLKGVVADEKGEMTGYTLAVRADRFDLITAEFLKNPTWQMDAEDIMKKDGYGSSAIELLAYRDQLKTLFQAPLWHKLPAQAESLIRAVPSQFFANIDPNKIMREVTLSALNNRSHKRNKNKFKL